MKTHVWKTVVPLCAAVIMAGCTGIPRQVRDRQILEEYLKYAGPPVDRITYLGRYDGWESLGRYQLVLWTGINDAYLITVSPPCEDLQFANRIGITQTANTIYSRFDFVRVRGWRCQISEIRPIDYRRMRADQRQQRAQEQADKAQGPENH
jgi:Family of unknown function (DUF6491)